MFYYGMYCRLASDGIGLLVFGLGLSSGYEHIYHAAEVQYADCLTDRSLL